jgi:hypothetical protein
MPAKAKTNKISSLLEDFKDRAVSEDEDRSPDFLDRVVERPFILFHLRLLIAASYPDLMGEGMDYAVKSSQKISHFAASSGDSTAGEVYDLEFAAKSRQAPHFEQLRA